MKKNPLDQFRSDLFGSRGCDIAAAVEYVRELATASSDSVAVMTAAHVLLNTAANAVHQVMNAPSPERLALIDLIDQRIDEHKLIREDQVDGKITDWMDGNFELSDSHVEDAIDTWMSNNFDIHDHSVDDIIADKLSDWTSDHLADEVERVIKNSLTFRVIVD